MIATHHRLLEALAEARAETDRLFALVRPEAIYHRPISERHRVLFYIGHLEAFDWNLLRPSLGLRDFDPALNQLFAFGIDPVDGGLPTDQPSDWPARDAVDHYVQQVRTRLDTALDQQAPPEQLLHVAIEHRWMHAETLSYMLHQMPLDMLAPHPQSAPAEADHPPSVMMHIPAGEATLGLDTASGEFGWDNEFHLHTVPVPAFSMDRYKVTNEQFLAFIEAGGYRQRRLWCDADWDWLQQAAVKHPAFWLPAGKGEYRYRTMFESIPLPLHWPVYVSHAEACAYACWAGKRLPTEAEWHRAAQGASAGGFPVLSRFDPSPVNAHPESAGDFGVEGMYANGWEWTSTVFAPFAGFEAFPFYAGYSANFFDGKHYVLKGGSPRTAASMLRPSFRNWFQPHYQYVYAGFRCAQ